MICPYCNQKFSKNATRHFVKCAKNHNKFISNKQVQFDKIYLNYPCDLYSREKLYKEYVINLKSLPDFLKEYGLPYVTTLFLLDYYEIPRRTIIESANLISKNKFKKTCLEKYGTTNVLSAGAPGYNKKIETCLEKYGVDNPFKAQFVIDKIQNDNHYLNKYGLTRSELVSINSKKVWASKSNIEKINWLNNSIHTPEAKQNSANKTGYVCSSYEQKIADTLNRLNLSYIKQYKIKYDNIDNKYYFYDFYLPDHNLLIEFNGDYWHANPKMYLNDDIVNSVYGKIEANIIWQKDIKKCNIAIKNNYLICYIWESDWKNIRYLDQETFILEKIKNEISNCKN